MGLALKRAHICRNCRDREYGNNGGDTRQGQTYAAQQHLIRHAVPPLEVSFAGKRSERWFVPKNTADPGELAAHYMSARDMGVDAITSI